MTPSRPLAAAVRLYRQSEHLTQAEMGRKLGLPQSSISAIESGDTSIDDDRIATYAAAFAIDPMTFLARALALIARSTQNDTQEKKT